MKDFFKSLLLAAFTVIAILGCSGDYDDKTVKIVDFTKSQTFEFTASSDSFRADTNVVIAFLFVKGEIEGKVGVGASGTSGGILSGKIDTCFRGDWFSPYASLTVSPIGNVKGELIITYRFGKI